MSKLAQISKNAFLEAVAEGAKEMPFAGSVLAALGGVSRARTHLKFQTFLEEIARPLAFGNIEECVARIAKNIEEPWMLDGLEEGWKTAQATLDPTAKLCVYVMVADYLAQEKPPDRIFRRFSNLFQESDGPILSLLLQISDHVPQFPPGGWLGLDMQVHNHTGEPLFFLRRYDTPAPEGPLTETGRESLTIRDEETFREVCDLLIRNAFALAPESLFGRETSFTAALIATHHRGLFGRLQTYLEPARRLTR